MMRFRQQSRVFAIINVRFFQSLTSTLLLFLLPGRVSLAQERAVIVVADGGSVIVEYHTSYTYLKLSVCEMHCSFSTGWHW